MDTIATETSPVAPKKSSPILLTAVIVILFAIFAYGLKWIFSLPSNAVGSVPFLLFDYAVGLTMIFLPCTLPLAFVIVPMAMGKSYAKGIGMAISFGVGVATTLSLYGLLIGYLGKTLGVSQIETAKGILYAFAGLLAFGFALGDLGLIRFKGPTANIAVPPFVLKQKDLFKAGLMGLFLGNVGVGCPNPLFNAIIIPQIIATGSPFQGWLIMLVQAAGRVTPLLILSFLAVLGVNATGFLVKHRETVARTTGWATVLVGGFLFSLGFFGHDWWVLSGQHTLFEIITQENFITNLLGSKIAQLGHTHGLAGLAKTGLWGVPIGWGTPALLFLWTFPMFWYWAKKKRGIHALAPEAQAAERPKTALLFWFFVMTTAFLVAVFGVHLPHMYYSHWSQVMPKMPAFQIELKTWPGPAQAGRPFDLTVDVHDDKGNPISDLQVTHTRLLHVILINESLDEFQHVHPEDSGSVPPEAIQNGEYKIAHLVLSKPGRYRVLVNSGRGGQEVSALAWLNVEGQPQPIFLQKDLRRERMFEGYKVTLGVMPPSPQANDDVTLSYHIQRVDNRVTKLQPYLGAAMHLAIMPLDLSSIVHTHGTISREEPSIIVANHQFRVPGAYKIYGQFQAEGRVITTEFMIEVAAGNQLNMQTMHEN